MWWGTQIKFPLPFQKDCKYCTVCWCGLSTAKADGVGPEGTLIHCHQSPVTVRTCTTRLHSVAGTTLDPTSLLEPFPWVLFSPQFPSRPSLTALAVEANDAKRSQGFSISDLSVFVQHSPFSWTCHFFDIDISPSPSSYPLTHLLYQQIQVSKVDQQNAAQCYFCMNRKLPTSYPLGSLSPQALEDKNHPPVKQKVWCDFSIRSHTKGLRPMKMSPYWLHTNVYSLFCL